MGVKTGIEWTHSTFNPWRGCVEVSPGCANCYAATLSGRNPTVLGTWGTERNGGVRVVAAPDKWLEPVRWNLQREAQAMDSLESDTHRVFCASLADVFEHWTGPMHDHKGNVIMVEAEVKGAERPMTMDDVRRRLFELWDRTPYLTWQVVTKRPELIELMLPQRGWPTWTNVWFGTTVENQEMANRRIPQLLLNARRRSPVLFLSVEPMLGPIKLAVPWEGEPEHPTVQADWVIVGCESGGKRRPCDLDWVRDVRDQCSAAGVPLFVKQLEIAGKVTTDIRMFPEDLQIQEFPD